MNKKIGYAAERATKSGIGTVQLESSGQATTSRDMIRKSKLYDLSTKARQDRPQDEVELQRNRNEYTFAPNSAGKASLATKKSSTQSGSTTFRGGM